MIRVLRMDSYCSVFCTLEQNVQLHAIMMVREVKDNLFTCCCPLKLGSPMNSYETDNILPYTVEGAR